VLSNQLLLDGPQITFPIESKWLSQPTFEQHFPHLQEKSMMISSQKGGIDEMV